MAHKSAAELRTVTHVSYLELLATKLHRTFTDNAYPVSLGRKSVAELQRITHVSHWSYGPQNFAALLPITYIWYFWAAKASPNFGRQRMFHSWSYGPQNFAAHSPITHIWYFGAAKASPNFSRSRMFDTWSWGHKLSPITYVWAPKAF